MGAYCTKQPALMQCHAIAIGILDLRFTIYDLRLHLVIQAFAVATTPSSSCVVRGGSRLSRPLLATHYHLSTTTYIFYTSTRPFFTMARAPSPRKHPRSDDALVVVRCAGGSRLSRPLLAAHHHLPTTTYIFYTPTHSPMRSTLHGHTSSSPTESIPCMRPPIRVPHDPYGKGIGIVPFQEVVAIGASKHKQHGGERVSDRCA